MADVVKGASKLRMEVKLHVALQAKKGPLRNALNLGDVPFHTPLGR